MGTTFTAELGPVLGFVVSCCCPLVTERARRFSTYEEASEALRAVPGGREYGQEALREPLPGCRMPECCPESPLMVVEVEGEPGPEVSMHSASALRVMVELGFPEEERPSGERPAVEFLERVLLAEGLALKEFGVPAREERRWFVGGREPGALARHLAELEELAHWCVGRGRVVVSVWRVVGGLSGVCCGCSVGVL